MKSEEDLFRELAEEVARNAYDEFMELVPIWTERSESPIERVLIMAWKARPIENICYLHKSEPWPPEALLAHEWTGSTDWAGSLNPQVTIGNYRADLYLQAYTIDNWESPPKIVGQWLKLVIECDGHDYHERTKEQARRDKRRDRWFQTHGTTVLRFAGSEIWADPLGCIDQIHDAFFAAWNRHKGR